MNLFDFQFYAPVYLGIFINLIVMFLLAYQGIIAFFINRKTDFDYAKPLLYLCVCSIGYSFSIIYAYFGIFRDLMYELSHAAIFLGVFTNTIYLNTLRKYTKAPRIFAYYEYLFIGFSLICLGAFWQSIFSDSDTILYNYGSSPRSAYVSLIAQYNGVGNQFCDALFGIIGISGALFSLHLLYHVFQTSRDKWIILGVGLNLILGLHDVFRMLFLLYNTFPLMSLSFVVEIMRMTFQMQNAAAKKVGKLEDEVNYLTQVARAGFAVGQICHDIRNPLSVIEGHNQLMLHHIDNPDLPKEKILRSVDKISVSSKRIGAILDNYLGEIYHTSDPKHEEISLKKIFEDAIELCSEKTKVTGISRIIYECSDTEFVYGVENQLVMAFVNLLSNSCDAIEALEDRWISIKVFKKKPQILLLGSSIVGLEFQGILNLAFLSVVLLLKKRAREQA
ncbi:MAG: histidine kinase dimerization/phospho-acceptor domain-containing protein [Oligoflexales bacterium]